MCHQTVKRFVIIAIKMERAIIFFYVIDYLTKFIHRKIADHMIHPRKTAKGTRFYKQEDIDAIRVVFNLVKERGMTLAGARQKLKDNKEGTIKQEEIINRLKQIKEELLSMKSAFENLSPEEKEE